MTTPGIAGTAEQLRCAPDPAAIRRRQDELMAYLSARSGHHRARQADGRTVELYVETNRWLADCLECKAGIEADVAIGLTCLGCGREYKAGLPAELEDVVEVLEARPDAATRNYYPSRETIADLVEENRLYGGIGVTPATLDDPHAHVIYVPSIAFDDGHDGGRYTDDSLAEELRARFGTGYVIHHVDATNEVVVELVDKDTKEVADLKRAVAGAEEL